MELSVKPIPPHGMTQIQVNHRQPHAKGLLDGNKDMQMGPEQ